MRDVAEIQRAHDLLVLATAGVDEGDLPILEQSVAVLCWVLGDDHENGTVFGEAVDECIRGARDAGITVPEIGEPQHACEGCLCSETEPCPTGCSWAPTFLAVQRWVCTRCETSMLRHEPPDAARQS